VGAVNQEFYKAGDLQLGAYVNVWGRNFLLCDCDEFTREYYRVKFGISKLHTGVTRNSQDPGQISKSSLPSPFLS